MHRVLQLSRSLLSGTGSPNVSMGYRFMIYNVKLDESLHGTGS